MSHSLKDLLKKLLPKVASVVFLSVWVIPVDVEGQVPSRVRILMSSPAEVKIQVETSPGRTWSFRNAYAGALGLADRVEAFQAFGSDGEIVNTRKLTAGEFRSDNYVSKISYVVKLGLPGAADVAHVSWIVIEHGVLMFADLLPQQLGSVSAEFTLPSGWMLESSLEPDPKGEYKVLDPDRAVFFVGRSLRKTSQVVDGMSLETVVSGNWPFPDAQASRAAARVAEKYLSLTGFRLRVKPMIMMAPVPVAVGTIKWRAETRGSTVILLMDPAAKIDNWIGQLGVIFTHELLHLWVPNSLRLQGDYDWFFEGFTLYAALLTALELKLINFQEYLDTLARVYDSYLSYADNLTLFEASERRWTTSVPLVYDKGMLVAFIYDLIVREESGSRSTVAGIYKDLFRRWASEQADGNEAIIGLLSSSPRTRDFAKSYIESRRGVDLEQVLPSYGFVLELGGTNTHLRVARDLSVDQKRLLRSLGYRN